MGVLSRIVADFKVTPEDLPRIEDALFFDGPHRQRSLERFTVLMFFATLIASYGIIADSTATVIGAMLVAPLMTPVLAIAAAVVTGQMRRAGFALLVVVGGVAGAIALAWIIGDFYHSGIISMTSNSQIVSRVSPRLVDLYAALGAGAVGAIATCRKDIADTMPGAAIAIALVPPLSVVGLALSQGAWGEAWGAMMLFLTNFFAILLAGSALFALLGLSAANTGVLPGHARRRAFGWIAIGTLLVVIPLGVTSYSTLTRTMQRNQVAAAVQGWLQGEDFEIVAIDLQPGGVKIQLRGAESTPPVDALIQQIEERIKHEVTLTLEVIPVQSQAFTVSPGGDSN
ncbi:MAG: DUF389 domain-containing protein [Caldilinea sp.]|nr:DUF389 domain-containing protein [Caldilinea sp.]MCB0039868.1 DUF389 domain-containing protein [Caldilinea sp.]MCB0054403.1 DUF389 domain-containing protein [Caldilinea sp.]MCB0134788.1 DUF389 domain-containing protein [Caldilineaceae bacterium]MCB0148128.1 DUF389 domain-containing protein [Caldilineaceae bacterium]